MSENNEIQMDAVQNGRSTEVKGSSTESSSVKSPSIKSPSIKSTKESRFNIDVKEFLKTYKYEILLGIIIVGSIIFKLWNSNILNEIVYRKGMNPKIPRVIYQCYKDKNVPSIVKERWLKLNPGYEYHLYDNDDCYKFILENYGKNYANLFKFIKDGPIKSDFWRVCILYKYGGIYADIDIFPLLSIDDFVNSDTTLYTCATAENIDNNLNPHFIAVEPNNPLILQCINIYMKDRIRRPYSYLGYSITYIMLQVLQRYLNIYQFKENIYRKGNQVVQLSQEICPSGNSDICYIEQNNKQIMKNRDLKLYDPRKHEFK